MRRPAPKPKPMIDHREQAASLAELYRPTDPDADREAGRSHAARARRLGALLRESRHRDLTEAERNELGRLMSGRTESFNEEGN